MLNNRELHDLVQLLLALAKAVAEILRRSAPWRSTRAKARTQKAITKVSPAPRRRRRPAKRKPKMIAQRKLSKRSTGPATNGAGS
jgi:hypothetical protein